MRVMAAICVVGAVLLSASDTWARVGAGIAVGDPAELNLRYWSRGHSGVDLGVGGSFQRSGGPYGHVDYLWSAATGDRDELGGSFQWYIGAGLWMALHSSGDGGEAGFRIPTGVDYILPDGRFGLFAEIAPSMSSSFTLYGGIGIRYLF